MRDESVNMNRLTAYPDGRLILPGGRETRCVLGKGGVLPAADKREGDGATPAGEWPLRRVFYRPDRVGTPQSRLDRVPLKPSDGWCDDSAHPLYNRPVVLPFSASHEQLWREDHVYDLIIEVGHNDDPVVRGMGSAIFIHLQREDAAPTEGCVALTREDMDEFLAQAGPETVLDVKL